MNKPTWLFIDPSEAFGGHQVMLLRWLQELHAQNEVHAVLLARVNSKLFTQAAGYATRIALPKASVHANKAMAFIRNLRQDSGVLLSAQVQHRPQLAIVAEGCLLAHLGLTCMARLIGMPTMVYVPLVEPSENMGFNSGKLRDWLVRHFYRHVPTRWLTITRQQAEQFAAWAHIKRPIHCLPNTVSPRIEKTKHSFLPARQPQRVLVLGRLDAHQKALDGLLDYCGAHPALRTEFKISLVGEGPYGAEIQRRLNADPVLAQWISLRSWAPTLDIMAEHDVLLLASRYEGVPLVVLEAMALGLPVVATDLPGVRSLLSPECLFAVGDYDRAVQRLRAVAAPDKRSEHIKRNLHVFAEQASGLAFAKAVRQLTQQLNARADSPVQSASDENAAVEL